VPAGPSRWLPAGELALLALWAAGLAAGLRAAARQHAAARRILRGARPAGSPELAVRFAELAAPMGLARPPALLVSVEVATPVAVARAAGLGAPAVVLPAGRELAGSELDMALCHELAHVRRGDLRLGWVPALAARLFFFHPLTRLAAREHALAREAACDAEVLACLAAPPAAYARLLLSMGAAGRLSSAAALGAAPPPGTLKRRLLMLDSNTRRPRAPWLGLAGLAALAALAPVRIVAQAAAPAVPATQAEPAAAAVVPVALAMAGPAPVAGTTTVHRTRHARHEGASEEYVLLSKDGDITMSGSTGDVDRARELAGPGESVLWFRRDGREHIVRDPALLAQARELFAPQRALGAQQGELGGRQGALGARQGALGAKQGALGARLGSVAAGRGAAADRESRDISRQMEDLARQQEELGRQQEELGRQQEQLGREQERLGREAEGKLKLLLDDAIAHGLAEEVR
jgi:bla regulator protein BlaR1